MKNYYNKASQDITSWSPTQDYAFLHNSLKKKKKKPRKLFLYK